jgi:hypothetical protein
VLFLYVAFNRYRETLIVMCPDGLSLLDGEAVQPQQREFLLRLQVGEQLRQMGAGGRLGT